MPPELCAHPRDTELPHGPPWHFDFTRCGVGAVHTVIVYEAGPEMVPCAPCCLKCFDTGQDARAYISGMARRGCIQSSVKQIQSVFVVIHEVDALTRHIEESEQGASAVVHVVQQNLLDLVPVLALHLGLD